MSPKMQRIFAWTGPVMLVVFFVGFEIARFVPPPAPNHSAGSVAGFFAAHATAIRAGMFIAGCGAALVATWSVAVSIQIRRISPRHAGYAYAELILGALLLVEFVIPIGLWEGIAFRPLAGPVFTLRLNDIAALMFVGVVATAVLEAILVGIAILDDPREVPIFPRWLGWGSVGLAVTFLPGGFCVFVHGGVFAWNGFYSWWVVLTTFAVWMLGLTWGVLRAITGQLREEGTEPSPAAARPAAAPAPVA